MGVTEGAVVVLPGAATDFRLNGNDLVFIAQALGAHDAEALRVGIFILGRGNEDVAVIVLVLADQVDLGELAGDDHVEIRAGLLHRGDFLCGLR